MQVLLKSPEGATIGATDNFSTNTEFSSPLRKIRIPMASLEETHNAKRVEEDRSLTIEACVVRIMKARKTMGHQALFTEVMSQLHFFKPNPKVIKKRIEHLIEREYIERDTADPNMYKYLA
jgi:cullin 1